MDYSAPYKQRGNLAEQGVKFLKKRVEYTMCTQGVHERLWNYCLCYEADIHNRIWNPQTGRTGWESVFGKTPDISEYLDFDFFSWVWFWEPGNKRASLGRWMGINHYCQEALSSFILKDNGSIVTCTTVQALTKDDLAVPQYISMMKSHIQSSNEVLTIKEYHLPYPEEVDEFRCLERVSDPVDHLEFSVEEVDEADKYDVDKLT